MFLNSSLASINYLFIFALRNVGGSNWSWAAKLFCIYASQRECLGLIEAKLWIRPRPHDDWAINGPSCLRPPLLESSCCVSSLHLSVLCVCVCACVPSFSVPALQSANRPPHLPVCLLTHLLLTSSSSCLARPPPPVSAPHYTHLVRPTRPPLPSVGSVLMRLMTT